jgi:hypothetical protein
VNAKKIIPRRVSFSLFFLVLQRAILGDSRSDVLPDKDERL